MGGVRRVRSVSDLDRFKLIEVNPHELDAVENLLLMTDQANANALDVSASERERNSFTGVCILSTAKLTFLSSPCPAL